MTPKEKRDMAITTTTMAGAFLLAILAVCYGVASIAAGLSTWMAGR